MTSQASQWSAFRNVSSTLDYEGKGNGQRITVDTNLLIIVFKEDRYSMKQGKSSWQKNLSFCKENGDFPQLVLDVEEGFLSHPRLTMDAGGERGSQVGGIKRRPLQTYL